MADNKKSINPTTLVIGGGIAGIQASLEIADAGQKVILVEKTGTIGGHMATFDKTFPTLDCAACILTPKMVDVGQHDNIDLLTLSEVKEIKGVPGNYTAKILKKARYINLDTCIGCGACAEKCPAKKPSEFDSGITLRRAAYIPFPQAVPNKYSIDPKICTYLIKGKCGVCLKKCPVPDCINFDDKDEEVEVTVGNIILACGFKPFDAARDERYGYGKYPNVVTSLEFERLVNASGPTGGEILLKSKDKDGVMADVPQGTAMAGHQQMRQSTGTGPRQSRRQTRTAGLISRRPQTPAYYRIARSRVVRSDSFLFASPTQLDYASEPCRLPSDRHQSRPQPELIVPTYRLLVNMTR